MSYCIVSPKMYQHLQDVLKERPDLTLEDLETWGLAGKRRLPEIEVEIQTFFGKDKGGRNGDKQRANSEE